MWRAPRCQSRRKGDLHRNKRWLGIPAQPILACQPAPREQLARRQPVAPSRHRRQSWAAIALGNDPLLFFQCPTASSARRDNFQSGDLRIRRMVSHTPMSSPSIAPRKAALAGAIPFNLPRHAISHRETVRWPKARPTSLNVREVLNRTPYFSSTRSGLPILPGLGRRSHSRHRSRGKQRRQLNAASPMTTQDQGVPGEAFLDFPRATS